VRCALDRNATPRQTKITASQQYRSAAACNLHPPAPPCPRQSETAASQEQPRGTCDAHHPAASAVASTRSSRLVTPPQT
jgi:hypothetical protein